MAKPRIKIAESASVGDIIIIKAMLSHKMESGQRKDSEGTVIPRNIIKQFTCEFNGSTVFSCDINPALAANPYFLFKAKVSEAGTFRFTWLDDDGDVIEAEKELAIS